MTFKSHYLNYFLKILSLSTFCSIMFLFRMPEMQSYCRRHGKRAPGAPQEKCNIKDDILNFVGTSKNTISILIIFLIN